jgi:hypothetical protein
LDVLQESGRQVSQIDELHQQLSDLMAECDEMRQRSRDEQLSVLRERDVHAQVNDC